MVSLTVSVARTVMFPPLACAASVVTELLVLVKDCPALIVMSPALPGPVLAAVMELPLFSVTDWPVVIVMDPPRPSPDAVWPGAARCRPGARARAG